MGKTMVEKMLGHSGGNPDASAGDIVNAKLSYLMTNDAVGELTAKAFQELQRQPWDRDRIAVVLDHYIPPSTENAARVHHLLRQFAREHGLRLFDQEGVCHQMMVEEFVAPGDVVIGTDSHTCTYGGVSAFATGVGSTDGAAAMATGQIWLRIPETIRIDLHGRLREHVHPKDVILHLIGRLGADGATYQALEFGGEGAASISIEGRLTMCNMAIECGAKTGIFEADEITREYAGRFVGKCANRHASKIDGGSDRPAAFYRSDADAQFSRRIGLDLDQIEPQVSCPRSVDNVVPVEHLHGTPIQQAFLGSCTNGRIEDLRTAAHVLLGNKVHPNVRLLVTPTSRRILQQAIAEGLIDIFLAAGAILCNPGCSACFGGQGMLWDGEACIGTHNRNFQGRMGHKDSRVFLASPETVVASAIAGKIADPRRVV